MQDPEVLGGAFPHWSTLPALTAHCCCCCLVQEEARSTPEVSSYVCVACNKIPEALAVDWYSHK